ncbi:MAG: zinc-dependent alcohol dehydrogenase, partial [Armatimonadaceae bacterium]
MKVLRYSAVRTLTLEETPDPTPQQHEVRVRILATGICGSDIHGYLGLQARRQPGLILGHETVGIVESAGDSANSHLIGQRVSVNPLVSCGKCPMCLAGRQSVCDDWFLIGLDRVNGAMADFVCVPARNVIPIPDSVSDKAAVMIEPLANGVHLLGLVPSYTGTFPDVLIMGGGTLGAATLAVAVARGWNVIGVVEPNPMRAAVMLKLGAPRVFDPRSENIDAEILDATGGRGPSVVADCVGRSAARQLACRIAAKGATILLLGMDEGVTEIDFIHLVRREVRLQCSYTYTAADYNTAINLIVTGK